MVTGVTDITEDTQKLMLALYTFSTGDEGGPAVLFCSDLSGALPRKAGTEVIFAASV